ncbi:MAG: hypothetical protein ACTSR5_02905 [Promethearchaeota archaeon]
MEYEEKIAKIKKIVDLPISKFKSKELKAIIERYEKNHVKSKEAFERARKIIPGGVEHNLAFNYPFPLTSKRVFDCYMETVDDIILTDYLMDGGPIILGHNHPVLRISCC